MKKNIVKKEAARADIYQQVTDHVIAELEKGNIIWQRGWSSYGMPKNIISGHHYRGWNIFWLNFLTRCKCYNTPYFITFKQAQEAGGYIRKGEKGIPIVYWASVQDRHKTITLTDKDGHAEDVHPTFRVPKQHIVFNIDQTEGIEFPQIEPPQLSEEQRIAICEAVITNMPQRPEIRHNGSEAYYMPSMDLVNMPLFGLFHTETGYYSTLFHELAHSTGHSSRLNRKELMAATRFGSETYSKEELTAELTAAFLCATCGIEQQTIINSIAYIQGWLKLLKDDKTLMLKAASQAQAAADFILSTTELQEQQQQTEEQAA